MTISTVEAAALWLIADALEDEGRCDVAGIESAAIRQGARRIEALEAQLAEAQARPVGVRVKPLVWEETKYGMIAKDLTSTHGGQYYAYERVTGDWVLGGTLIGPINEPNQPSWEAAKAAAQADYERRILSALEPAPVGVEEAAREPDYYYDAENWEYTCDKTCVGELVESVIDDLGRERRPVCIRTLFQGPDKWVANVPLDTDGDGDVDDWEIQWFDSEDAALRALSGEAGE